MREPRGRKADAAPRVFDPVRIAAWAFLGKEQEEIGVAGDPVRHDDNGAQHDLDWLGKLDGPPVVQSIPDAVRRGTGVEEFRLDTVPEVFAAAGCPQQLGVLVKVGERVVSGRDSVVSTHRDCEGHRATGGPSLAFQPFLQDDLAGQAVWGPRAGVPELLRCRHVQPLVPHAGGQLFDLAGKRWGGLSDVVDRGQPHHERPGVRVPTGQALGDE